MPSPQQIEQARERRRKVLRAIATSINTVGYPPSVSELATKFQVSTLSIRRDLTSLEADGKIARDPGVARGIRLSV